MVNFTGELSPMAGSPFGLERYQPPPCRAMKFGGPREFGPYSAKRKVPLVTR